MYGIYRNILQKCNFTQKFFYSSRQLSNNFIIKNKILCAFKSASTQNLCIYRTNYCIVSLNRTMATGGPSKTTETDTARPTNRLSLEKSPYLLQHATNPVNWYPWSEEAFEKAKKENKLIFLSVGYSTCHWCHVMEKESFENPSVAEILNRHFISVKVDREERPDVDKVYMMYVQRTTGSGGWPMSVFLTPALEPVFGGTYFPPDDKYGRVGFRSLLTVIAKQWSENYDSLGAKAKISVESMRRLTKESFARTEDPDIPDDDTIRRCSTYLLKSYDREYGGFSGAPKFPQPCNLNLLFHEYARDPKSERGAEILDACLHTLRRMAYGGIHDHVNTGFARYSVDSKWHVPHFEKMLYDQGQLAATYADAYAVTANDFYKETVDDIVNYVCRDLNHAGGGFYGAEDADSYPDEKSKSKVEGAFCVWEHGELLELIKDEEAAAGFTHLELLRYHYGVKEEGNVSPRNDPHGELKGKNVLCCFGSYEETAAKFKVSVEAVKAILDKCHRILYAERQRRPPPHVDTKIVTAWNGLAITGISRAGYRLKNDDFTDRAVAAAEFIRKNLYDEDKKMLLRCCYGDEKGISQISVPIYGFLTDYAFLIRGLIDLYEATLDTQWLQWAETLQDQQNNLFWDPVDYGYFTSPEGDANIVIRDKEDQDGAEPSGNSVSAQNLLRLASYLNRYDYEDKAGKTLTAFAERIRHVGFALPEMVSALMHFKDHLPQVVIVGSIENPDTEALLDTVRGCFVPGLVLMVMDEGNGGSRFLAEKNKVLQGMKMIRDRPTAYVCRNFTCSLPVVEPEDLRNLLLEESQKKSK